MKIKSLSIAIIGYGKMGQTIEKLALERDHRIAVIIDNEQDWHEKSQLLAEADVAIEFSTPQQAPANIIRCFENNTAVVCGTTAWYDQLEKIVALCHEKRGTLFYAPNFSIGVNIFFELNRKLASLLAESSSYHPSITEIHHVNKLDAPSGTAVALGNDIAELHSRIETWKLFENSTNNDTVIESHLLPIYAIRQEQVPGTHMVSYNSAIDTIEIKHTAHSRQGFSEGALEAAKWVTGKTGVFTMKDLLNL